LRECGKEGGRCYGECGVGVLPQSEGVFLAGRGVYTGVDPREVFHRHDVRLLLHVPLSVCFQCHAVLLKIQRSWMFLDLLIVSSEGTISIPGHALELRVGRLYLSLHCYNQGVRNSQLRVRIASLH
jgi:hypothetical protein